MNRKFIVWRLLWLFMLLSFVVEGAAASEENQKSIRCKYVWAVANGKPCAVRYGDPEYPLSYTMTYFFNGKGDMRVMLEEYTDAPESSRPLQFFKVWVFDGIHSTVGVKKTDFKYVEGGKIKPVSKLYSYYGKPKQKHYYDDILNYIIPTRLDEFGNWIEGKIPGKEGSRVIRKIYYAERDPEMAAKTAAMLVEADSLEAAFKEKAVKRNAEGRVVPPNGWGYNFFLPLIFSILVTWLICRIFIWRPKYSNLAIIVMTVLAVVLPSLFIILPTGPYEYFWELLYWVLALAGWSTTLHFSLYGRCPRCGHIDFEVTGHVHRSKTTEEYDVYEDGHKDLTYRGTDYERDDLLHCKHCGHNWKHTWIGMR